MPRNEHFIRVMTEMDVSRAVVQTKRCAEACGFADDMATMITTAASELARNILKYAGNGELIIRPVEDQTREGLQIEARDRGPGIMDIESALRDHVSDAGTLPFSLFADSIGELIDSTKSFTRNNFILFGYLISRENRLSRCILQ